MLDIFKHFIFALIATAFLVAPVAEAKHTIEDQLINCDVDHDVEHSEDTGSEHTYHDQHMHSCGSCHVHLLEQDLVPKIRLNSPKSSHSLPPNAIAMAIMPMSIFRPPQT